MHRDHRLAGDGPSRAGRNRRLGLRALRTLTGGAAPLEGMHQAGSRRGRTSVPTPAVRVMNLTGCAQWEASPLGLVLLSPCRPLVVLVAGY